jgi:tRNA dimethylallyltransferase
LKRNKLIVIAGPTAVGKTSFAVRMAKELKTEILSADARQFYKETVIGTAAPSIEEREGITHHFIGHLSVSDYYNVYAYEQQSIRLLDKLFERYPFVILAGGSGLYIDAVCFGIDDLPDVDVELRESLEKRMETEGLSALSEELRRLDPTYYNAVDRQNPKRILRALEVCIQTSKPYSSLRTQEKINRNFDIVRIALTLPRPVLNDRINLRTHAMMEKGLLEEVRSLLPYKGLNALNTVGYKELFDYLSGKCSLETSVEKIKTNTRRYAKRQMTWFKRNNDYTFFEPSQYTEILKFITDYQ